MGCVWKGFNPFYPFQPHQQRAQVKEPGLPRSGVLPLSLSLFPSLSLSLSLCLVARAKRFICWFVVGL